MIKVIRGDITSLPVDAIVNAANAQLQNGGGVCGAIFKKAGLVELQNECNQYLKDRGIKQIPVGSSIITNGYNIPSKIIHSVGCIYKDGKHNEAQELASAYLSAMALLVGHGLKSIAFPFISSGIYRYPKQECAQVAIDAIKHFVSKYDIDVTMCLFSEEDYNLFADKF